MMYVWVLMPTFTRPDFPHILNKLKGLINKYFPLYFQWSANSRLRWLATLSLYILSYTLVIVTAPLSFFFVLVRIPEYERAVVLGSTIDLVR